MNKHNNSEFRKIMKKIVKGDKNALGDFFNMYGKFLTASARRFYISHDWADEIINDVLVKVWQSAAEIMNYEFPEAWLNTVVANTAKDYIRRKPWILIDDDVIIDENAFSEIEDKDEFEFLIKGLSAIEQDILTYKFIQRYTFEEIAKITEKGSSSISTIYYRALEKIKKIIEKN